MLRTLTVTYMMENQSVFNSICDNVAEHISDSEMVSLGVWGTEVEILELATMLDMTIYAYSKCGDTNKWIPYRLLLECGEDSHQEGILISNLSHHFEPAVL